MVDLIGPAHPGFQSDCGTKHNLPAQKIVIALSGYARSGKDTVADYLTQHYGFTKFAFADKLRECLYALNPVIRANEEYNHPFEGPVMYRHLRDVIDEDGWDGYKEGYYGNEIRRLLQRMGTEVGRNLISDTIWVDEIDKFSGKIIVTDCRFPNEAEKIKSRNGQVWRITRPETMPVNPHISEVSLDHYNFDEYINNDAGIAALGIELDYLMDKNKIPRKMV